MLGALEYVLRLCCRALRFPAERDWAISAYSLEWANAQTCSGRSCECAQTAYFISTSWLRVMPRPGPSGIVATPPDTRTPPENSSVLSGDSESPYSK